MKGFKPMLAPNELPDLNEIKYPILASYKLDGIRCIFHPELGMVSRSLKPIPNKQLQEKFQFVLEYCQKNNIILDGELYSHTLTFQAITRAVMTQDFYDKKTQKKFLKMRENEWNVNSYIEGLIHSISFFCFDALLMENEFPFTRRVNLYYDIVAELNSESIKKVNQTLCESKENIIEWNQTALNNGYEGLILKDVDGFYKFGRATLNQGLMYKVKPYIDMSAIIKEVIQETVVNPDAEKKINELGYSETSRKKDDRILIPRASAFLVDWGGKDLKVTIAATQQERDEIWKDRVEYIGKEVNFKAMEIGVKDLPRHPIATRWWKHDE